MKHLIFAILLVSFQLNAHGDHSSHGTPDQVATGASVFWNGYEMVLHGVSFLGYGESPTCCGGHMTKTYHAIEVIGHGSNLYGGVTHYLEKYTPPAVLTGLSLVFNIWAAHSQYRSLRSRGATMLGLILAPMGAMDLWGHGVSAYVAARELVGV